MAIEGVKIKKVISHHDDRGFFAEMVKFGEETFHDIKQTSYAETKPGIIKAFHLHDYWESWCVVKGAAKVVLADIREGSPTKGKNEVLYVDEKNLAVIAIPPGVAHGYQVLGAKPMGIVYHAAEAYDPKNPTIKSTPYDSPEINFNWNEAPRGKPRGISAEFFRSRIPSFAPRQRLGASEGLFSPPSSTQQAAGYSAKENKK